MKEQIMKLFRETMGKMFRCTVDLIEKDLIPANRQYERAYPKTNVWCVGYRDACRFIAEALQKQAERFEQPESPSEPEPIQVGCCIKFIGTGELGVIAQKSQSMPGHFKIHGVEGWWPQKCLRFVISLKT